MISITRDITPIAPETILTIGNFHIANSSLLILLITAILLLVIFFSVRKFKLIPTGFQSAIELLYEGMESMVEQITGDKKHTEVIFPVIATIFLYIGISNLIGLIPGLTSITVGDTPLFRSPTADFNTTFGLSLGSIIVLHWISIRDWGFFGHLGKFFKFKEIFQGFKKSIGDGMMAIIDFLIGLLDIIGEIAKVVSLSLRLFGNMYAGEVLAIIILGAFAYIVPSVWTAMNLLVGVIQALVFGSLVAAYYMLSIDPDKEKKKLEKKQTEAKPA
ncbi:MAG: F-type H+-transporting ATPase subunit a [Candidatus Paceibacteria bacterium]|jgi:F-type H+-transporting ATPase subunit a